LLQHHDTLRLFRQIKHSPVKKLLEKTAA
jgi:hypothetical protein